MNKFYSFLKETMEKLKSSFKTVVALKMDLCPICTSMVTTSN